MNVLGLDIGGANIKAAHSDGRAASIYFALWQNPERLGEKLIELAEEMQPFDELVITMTGELCDCFATKREGVNHILDAVDRMANGKPVRVWSTAGHFVLPDQARQEPIEVSAANWHGLATYVGYLFPDENVLLVDTGSTTTDVIAIERGTVAAKGLTDPQRLATGELVYVGARRTPLMVLGPTVSLEGQTYSLMSEWFADSGDVCVVTGDVAESPDDCQTADGQPMTKLSAGRRIARMIGADEEMLSADQVRELAHQFRDRLVGLVVEAIERVEANRDVSAVVISGSGAFLARDAVMRVLSNSQPIFLSDRIGETASSAACAYALVQLAKNFTTEDTESTEKEGRVSHKNAQKTQKKE